VKAEVFLHLSGATRQITASIFRCLLSAKAPDEIKRNYVEFLRWHFQASVIDGFLL
jgi:hypothetical protein